MCKPRYITIILSIIKMFEKHSNLDQSAQVFQQENCPVETFLKMGYVSF
jgi:hypothetical protein